MQTGPMLQHSAK